MSQLIDHLQAIDLRDHLSTQAYYADSATQRVVEDLRDDLDRAISDAAGCPFVVIEGELDDHLYAAGIKGLPYDED